MPQGRVKPDETGGRRAECAQGGSRSAAERRGSGGFAGKRRGSAVPPLALQRPSAFLRLHHVEPGTDWHAWRSAGGAVNQNCGWWTLSPMATEIEAQTVRWIAEFIGYGGLPRPSGQAATAGLLVSGGNMANFVCFLAARTAKAGLGYSQEWGCGTAMRRWSCMRQRKPTRGFRKRPTSSGSAPMRSAGSPSMSISV